MKGYTRKVGLRKPKRRVPIGLFQVLSEEQAAQVREHGHLKYKPDVEMRFGVWTRTSCPHCPCTQTTECCYCDSTRTPLEDS